MIIFELTLTTFEASFIFWGSWGSIKNWLELKIEPPLADLALLNSWNTLYVHKKGFFYVVTHTHTYKPTHTLCSSYVLKIAAAPIMTCIVGIVENCKENFSSLPRFPIHFVDVVVKGEKYCRLKL
jgi:hypothetical protein